MGIFFPPDYGVLEINSWHSDNEIYCRDVRFAIPIEKWSEFESSPMYQELSAYVEGLQTQDTRCENYEPECTEENEMCMKNSTSPVRCESFWVRAHRALCHRLRR